MFKKTLVLFVTLAFMNLTIMPDFVLAADWGSEYPEPIPKIKVDDEPTWGQIALYGALAVGAALILYLLIKPRTPSQSAEKNGQDKEDSINLASKSKDQILTPSGNLMVFKW